MLNDYSGTPETEEARLLDLPPTDYTLYCEFEISSFEQDLVNS